MALPNHPMVSQPRELLNCYHFRGNLIFLELYISRNMQFVPIYVNTTVKVPTTASLPHLFPFHEESIMNGLLYNL